MNLVLKYIKLRTLNCIYEACIASHWASIIWNAMQNSTSNASWSSAFRSQIILKKEKKKYDRSIKQDRSNWPPRILMKLYPVNVFVFSVRYITNIHTLISIHEWLIDAWNIWWSRSPENDSSIWINMNVILIPATANGYSQVALSPSFLDNNLWYETWFHVNIH